MKTKVKPSKMKKYRQRKRKTFLAIWRWQDQCLWCSIARTYYLKQHADIETERGPLAEEEVAHGHTHVHPGEADHQGSEEVLRVRDAESHQDEVEGQGQVYGLDHVLPPQPLRFLGDQLAELDTDDEDRPNCKQS